MNHAHSARLWTTTMLDEYVHSRGGVSHMRTTADKERSRRKESCICWRPLWSTHKRVKAWTNAKRRTDRPTVTGSAY